MQVPAHSQIRPGTAVSIVLKQDQGTGRQVTGTVSEVLTRDNHPRGVKVRLVDGRVGRVQSLVTGAPSYVDPASMPESQSWQNQHTLPDMSYSAPLGNYMPPAGPPPGVQRTDSIPVAEGERAEQIEHLHSFEMMKNGQTEDERNQEFLQKEFPDIDGSLIAAIYGDSKDLGQTRELLQELGR